MSITHTILQKVFVREFYRSNASFFLLVIGLAGGFMRSYDHIALAEFFISSWLTMLIPLAVWALYTLKVINFNLELMVRPEQDFIFHFNLLPRRGQWLSMLACCALQLVPAFLYGLFLVALAAKYQFYLSAFLGTTGLIVLLLYVSWRTLNGLNHPHPDSKPPALNEYINKTFTKPYPVFFIEWVIRRETLLVIGSTLFSIIILLGVLNLYNTDVYDFRLLAIGLVVVAGAMVQLIQLAHRFENFHFNIMRGLPLSMPRRVVLTVTTHLLLLLPIFGILITRFPSQLSFVTLLESLLFLLATILFWNGILYQRDRDLEALMKLVFGVSIVLIILILFKTPLLVLASLKFVIGLYLWMKYYYRFEYLSTQIEATSN